MEFRLPGVPPSDLVELYERRGLSDREYKLAIEWATKPPARERWAGYLRDWCLVFGLILLVAGVVVFGAYNWQALPHLQKLGLLQTLLVGAWVGSRLREADSLSGKALLWTACMLVGALLAVFGQIYQTGADAFALFLTWSALIVPWCLSGRSNLIWASQAVLLNLTLVLYWDQRISVGLAGLALAYAAFSGGLAVLWNRLRPSHAWMKAGLGDALFANAMTPLTVAGCAAFWEGEAYLPSLALCLGVAGWSMTRHRNSWPLRRLAVPVFSLTVLAAAATIRALIGWDVPGMLLIALALLAEVTLAASWLRRVDREIAPEASLPSARSAEPDLFEVLASNGLLDSLPDGEQRRHLRPTPAYVSVLAAVGAWLSSWFFLGFVGLGLSGSESGMMVTGLLLWAGTILGRRALGERSEFLAYLCLAVNLAGQLMVMLGMTAISGMTVEAALGVAFFLQGVGLLWFKDRLGCGLFAFASVISGGLFLWSWAGGWALNWWLLAVALGLSRLLIGQRGWLLSRWRQWHGAVALGWCFGFLLMVGVWNSGLTWGWGWGLGWSWGAPQPGLLAVGLTVLAAANAVRLQAPLTAVAGLLLLGALTFTMPGLMAALLVFMLAFHTRSAGASRLSILALLVFGVLYYYNLDLSFLAKSATLVASGLLLLLVRSGMRGAVARHAF